MATQRTSTTIKKVIRVTREEIDAILRDKYGCKGDVEWVVAGQGYVDGVDLTHEVTTYAEEEKI